MRSSENPEMKQLIKCEGEWRDPALTHARQSTAEVAVAASES